MTFSQALVSKAQSVWERKLLWDKNSCKVQWHFWEGQVRSHPISHFLDPRWERHHGLTRAMQELCPLMGEQYVTYSAPLTCFHQVTWPDRFLEVCLPCWIPWTAVYTCILKKQMKKPETRKSDSRRILLLRERHHNFVFMKLLTYIIYTQKCKGYCRWPNSHYIPAMELGIFLSWCISMCHVQTAIWNY